MIIPSVVPAIERLIYGHILKVTEHDPNNLVIATVTPEDDIQLYVSYSYVDEVGTAYTDELLITATDVIAELYSMETEM